MNIQEGGMIFIINYMFDSTHLLYENNFFLWLLGLFVPPGHIDTLFPVQALYPEPRTRPYDIRIYCHPSLLRALTTGRFRPTRPPTVVGKICFVTSSESRPIPTGYSLYALNPLLPGLKPRPAPLALAEVCVISVNWACHPLAPAKAQLPTGLPNRSPASLGLVRPQIQPVGQCSVADKPHTS